MLFFAGSPRARPYLAAYEERMLVFYVAVAPPLRPTLNRGGHHDTVRSCLQQELNVQELIGPKGVLLIVENCFHPIGAVSCNLCWVLRANFTELYRVGFSDTEPSSTEFWRTDAILGRSPWAESIPYGRTPTSIVRTSQGIMTCLKMAGSGQTLTCLPRWPPWGLIHASLGTSPLSRSK